MPNNRSLGNFQAPNLGAPKSMGIQDIMPFIGQAAMMNRMMQIGQVGQNQASTGQAPPGMVAKSLSPSQVAPEFVNPQAGAQEEQAKNAMQSSESFNKALNVIKVAMPIMKGAYAQQGGQSGFIPGLTGGLAAKIGMDNTYDIGSLHQAFNDVTANIAQQYSGNQGISRLFSAFSGGTPEGTDSEHNAFAKLITAGKTAYGIAKGVSNAGLTSDQLRSMDPNQVQKIIGNPHSQYTPEEGKIIEDLLTEEYKKTPGAIVPNPKTGMREPLQPNALNRGLKGITDLFSSGGSQQKNPVDELPSMEQAPKNAVGYSKSKKAFVDATGNVVS